MKVIDLINMIDNKEELPERMIINKRNFHSNVFKSMIYEEDCNTDIWMAIELRHINLNDTVEIIEDETIDIESIEEIRPLLNCRISEGRLLEEELSEEQCKINKLVQAVKQLNKEIKSIKEK